MNKVMKTCFASVVSELQQSDIFMTVKARLVETPKANLNGVRVTSAFLNEVVENEEKYVGLPLVADVKALANGRYDHLGHLYDARTGQFHTTQIGSFYKFEREDFEGGSYLIGYARIAKRNKALCRAVAELFADGALKFSFEISCGEYRDYGDGTTVIDIAENNFLEGEAIVSFPACEDAVALELVAECDRIADDLRKGENEMTDVNESAEIVAEETVEEVQAEQTEEEACKKKAEEDEAACKKKSEEETEAAEAASESAAVYVTETHEERDTINMYDTDTDTNVEETVIHETRVNTREEDISIVAEGEDAGSESEAETDASSGEETPDVGDTIVVNVEPTTKKTAEDLIAELTASIEELRAEIAELKEKKTVVAEAQVVNLNPFGAEIGLEKKYSLLEKAEPTHSYSLLEKA